jgi:hypothetical protein
MEKCLLPFTDISDVHQLQVTLWDGKTDVNLVLWNMLFEIITIVSDCHCLPVVTLASYYIADHFYKVVLKNDAESLVIFQ